MARKIMGIKKFVSKKGSPICNIFVETDFTDKEKTGDNVAAEGIKTETIWVFSDDMEKVNKGWIGKNLVGFFGYSNGNIVCQSPDIEK